MHMFIHCVYRVVGLWKEKLAVTNQKAAQSLADPGEYENLFPGLQEAILAEEALRGERAQLQPASSYPHTTVREGLILCHVYSGSSHRQTPTNCSIHSGPSEVGTTFRQYFASLSLILYAESL